MQNIIKMIRMLRTVFVISLLLINAIGVDLFSRSQTEKIDRGLVALKTGNNSVYLSWRLLNTDYAGTTFNIYHAAGNDHFYKINQQPVFLTTDTMLTGINPEVLNRFFVCPVFDGRELESSKIQSLSANSEIRDYRAIPLRKENHYVQHAWPADLDGDGAFELVVSRLPFESGNALLEAYTLSGRFLWRVDMGPQSVRKSGLNGANDAPPAAISGYGNVAGYRDNDNVTVFDLDGDGKAEVLVRTATGVVFADGKILKDADSKQFISVINGGDGKEKSRIPVPNDFMADGPVSGHFGIAFLDGKHPSLIAKLKNRVGDRAKKFNQIIAAYDLKLGKLFEKWKIIPTGAESFHQIRIVDVDGDGKDDICDGSYVIGSDGKMLYQIPGVIHGDRFHVADIDPNRPGLEGYGIQQMEGGSKPEFPWYYYDAANGKILFSGKEKDVDTGRGTVADIDPDHPGMEMWSLGGLFNVSGEKISDNVPVANFRIWWDGDLQDEILDRTNIIKWDHRRKISQTLFSPAGVRHNTRNAPPFYGDILGDWREEVIWESSHNSELRIYSTTIPAESKMITALQNRAYRLCLTVKGYMQSTMPDCFPIK